MGNAHGTWQQTGGGGGGLEALAAVVGAIVLLAFGAHALTGAAAAVGAIVTIILWAAAGVVAAAALGGVAYVVYRRRHPRQLPARAVPEIGQPRVRQLPPSQRPAIEQAPVHIHHHWHGVTAEQVAAALRDHQR